MEEKVARICWNSNGWLFPSGAKGKSLNEDSFEKAKGYGHEEWLADNTKLIDGYKFSFLQPLNTKKKSHQGKEYSILLYTLNEGRKMCVGHIKHAICLTKQEAENATAVYHQNGWFEEMKAQLKEHVEKRVRLVSDEVEALHNFNVKFKPADIEWFDEPEDVSDLYRIYRYNLLSKHDSNNTRQADEDFPYDDFSSDVEDILSDDLSDSEIFQNIMARVGQGKFRRSVIQMWGGEEKCAVSLVDIKEILIASHIKAWKDCETTKERLDGANGILLCAHIDKLFDRHLITFEQKNNNYKSSYLVKISKSINRTVLKGLAIENGIELNTSSLNSQDLKRFELYMQHHNKIFFSKEESA